MDRYNLRPYDSNLVSNCVKTPYCQDCKYRVGCPIRYSFYRYKTDLDFEIEIQTIEILIRSLIGNEDLTLRAVNRVRAKRELEILNNPRFSYT